MWPRTRASCMFLFSLLAISVSPCVSQGAEKHRQSIKNNTGGDVNDLKLRFTDDLSSKPKLWHTGGAVDVNDNDRNDASERVDASSQSASNFQADWAQSTFGRIPNGGIAEVDFEGAPEIDADHANSQWTLDGVNKGAPVVVGEPMHIAFNLGTSEASVTFVNNGATAITYSDIQLFKNNSVAQFDLLQFMEATGTAVSAPSTIVLNPGQVSTISLGIVQIGSTYQLAIARVSENANPSVLYSLVTGATPLEAMPATSRWGVGALMVLLLSSGVWMVVMVRKAATDTTTT